MGNRDMSEGTMALLGKPVPESAGRDAIHIAVAPVVATERLAPGQHIGLVGEGKAGPSSMPVGIVDPYLLGPVFEGERFFLFLYPQTITSLRHEWTHPAFALRAAPTPMSTSEAWLRTHAGAVGVSYGVLMDAAKEWLEFGEYHTFSYDTPDAAYESNEDFWRHYEVVTGTRVASDKKQTFFSCSC